MDIGAWTESALSGRRPQIYGDGNWTKDLIFISDVVDAVRRCADCPDPKGQPLNICSGHAMTANQVVKAITKEVGRPDLEPEYLPPRQGDVDGGCGDNARAKELLDWEPKVRIEKGLVELVDWYRRSKGPIVPAGVLFRTEKKY